MRERSDLRSELVALRAERVNALRSLCEFGPKESIFGCLQAAVHRGHDNVGPARRCVPVLVMVGVGVVRSER
jgi:hypothetical protein